MSKISSVASKGPLKSGIFTSSDNSGIISVTANISSMNIKTTNLSGANPPPPPPPPLNMCIIINILHYLKPFSKTLILADPLDNAGTEAERAAFMALRFILNQLNSNNVIINNIINNKNDTGKDPEPINIYPFLDKFCTVTNSNFHRFDELDVSFVWDNIIKLICNVVPPLRKIFYGLTECPINETAPWLSNMSRCLHVQFEAPLQSLEEVITANLSNTPEVVNTDVSSPSSAAKLRIKESNTNILNRNPDILVFIVESSYLPQQLQQLMIQATADSVVANKSAASSSSSGTNPKTIATNTSGSNNSNKNPTAIKFPQSFDLSTFLPKKTTESDGQVDNRSYELTSIISLEGQSFETVQAYYRVFDIGEEEGVESDEYDKKNVKWFKGSGPHHEEVEEYKIIERNCFNSCETKSKNRVHPRLLIYVKKDFESIYNRLRPLVTKSGQMKMLADKTFESAKIPEDFDEARQYYEHAINFDESGDMKIILQEKVNLLDQIERNQRAQCYENQGDNSLGKKRYKEACDLYKIAIRSLNSPNSTSSTNISSNNAFYQRIKEKEELVVKIISLEISNHLCEKGEDCLKNHVYPQAKDQFAQSLKLNPDYIILQMIVAGIEKSITSQTSFQKITEANQAMKVGKYKLANQLFLEAIALVPEKRDNVKHVLEGLVVLMQGEDALIKQRTGLLALEDKKYSLAISLITEAIEILPPDSVAEHSYFLCDRALVYFEMKDYETAMKDCREALTLKPDLAIAYLRLGSAQFELELYDDATLSYEKAIKNDSSLNEQVKVKVRQVNTAKEVLRRKEREAERARLKEEEKKMLEEKRLRDEQIKKEKQERLAQEQMEKSERARLKEEERLTRSLIEKEQQINREKNKEAEKERTRLEKLERDAQRAAERERARAEKEKERERIRLEKEQKLIYERKAQADELQKQREFSAEMERAELRLKEAEREKELEKEKARLEREKLIAEREKARNDKLLEAKKTKPVVTDTKVVATSSITATESFPTLQNPATTTTTPNVSTNPSPVVPVTTTKPPGKSWNQPPPAVSNNTEVKHKPVVTAPPPAKWSAILASNANETTEEIKSSTSRSKINNDFPSLSEVVQNPSILSSSSMKSSKSDEKFPQPAESDFVTPKISSAWADHQRALLEASADSLSLSTSISIQTTKVATPVVTEKKEIPTNNNDIIPTPPHVVPVAPVAPPVYVTTTTTIPIASPQPEPDNLSPLLSTLRYGGSGESLLQTKGIGGQNDLQGYSFNLNQPTEQSSLFSGSSDLNSYNLSQPVVVNLNSNQFYTSSVNDRVNPNNIIDSSIDSFMNFDNYNDLLDSDLSYPNNNNFDNRIGNNNNTSSSSSNKGIMSSSGQFGGGNNLSLGATFINQAPLPPKPIHSQSVNNINNGIAGGSSGVGGYLQNNSLNFGLENDYFGSGKQQYGSGLGSLGNFDYSNDISSFLLDDVIGSSSLGGGYNNNSNSLNNPFNSGGGTSSSLLSNSVNFPSSSMNQQEALKLNDLLGTSSVGGSSSSSGAFGFHQSSSSKGLMMNDYLGHNSSSSSFGQELNLVRPMPIQSRNSSSSSSFDVVSSIQHNNQPFASSSGVGFGHNSNIGLDPISPQKTTTTGSFLNAIGTNRIPTASLSPPPIATNNKQTSEGIDSDILPENVFTSVSWLRQYHMHMYRWAGDNKEWTEYAMHIPIEMYHVFLGTESIIKLIDLTRSSGCEIWVDEEFLGGKKEKFIVFFRGSSGLPSNQAMNVALDIISNKMKQILNPITSISHPSSSNNNNNSLGLLGATMSSSNVPKVSISSGDEFKTTQTSAWTQQLNNNNPSVSSLLSKGMVDVIAFEQTSLTDLLEKEMTLNRFPKKERPELLRINTMPGTGYMQRSLEIPREVVGLIIGQSGKKIRELCTESGAKIQFRVNKTAEREGRPGLLEVQGSADNVDKGLQLIWDLLQMLGKEYVEVPFQSLSPRIK